MRDNGPFDHLSRSSMDFDLLPLRRYRLHGEEASPGGENTSGVHDIDDPRCVSGKITFLSLDEPPDTLFPFLPIGIPPIQVSIEVLESESVNYLTF